MSPSKKVSATGRPKPPNAGKGRPKGSLNKTTASIKQAITEAFDKLGGVDSLVQWGHGNPDGFYQLWGRLAPKELEVSGPAGGGLVIRIVKE